VLDKLSADDFAPAVGQPVVVSLADGSTVDLELISARTHDPDAPSVDAQGRRSPFTIAFRGPAQPVLPQATYRIDGESIEPMEIFIVPLGRDQAGTTYEAIFA
jgi:hypothetical protein